MGRTSRKEPHDGAAGRPPDPEAEEKQRLRSLAVARKLISRAPAKPAAPLHPSRNALKLDGRDIVKRGQRRSRYLFSFPGLLAPVSGGRVGELADLATKNPVLYLEFPQGRMKLLGTHVYPKNRYLTLQLSKSAKGVTCEDSFDSLIVFSDAYWIGSKEENPDELQLEFPKDLNKLKQEYDFKGGAGASFEEESRSKPPKEYAESLSLDTGTEEDEPRDSYFSPIKKSENLQEATPIRHSARTVGKKFNFAEVPSGGDSSSTDAEGSDIMEEKVTIGNENAIKSSRPEKIANLEQPTPGLLSSEHTEKKARAEGHIMEASSLSKVTDAKPLKRKGKLVQTTLFDIVVDKKPKLQANESSEQEEGSNAKKPLYNSKKKIDFVEANSPKQNNPVPMSKRGVGSNSKKPHYNSKKKIVFVEANSPKQNDPVPTPKRGGTRKRASQKQSQVQSDDMEEREDSEEISSDSPDDSDEDWAA